MMTILNILDLFSKKNEITNNTNDFNEHLNLKATINNPTFTGTVNGITKHMIGLGNVNNSTDLNKPISNATQTALNLKADSDDTYTKTEVDNNLLLKQDLLAVLSLPGQIGLLNGNLIKPLQSGNNVTITDAGTHVVIASTGQSSSTDNS